VVRGAPVEVDLDSGRVTVAATADRAAIAAAIRGAGYEAD
jgi:hypothetical protein